jgi:hypothetical protein
MINGGHSVLDEHRTTNHYCVVPFGDSRNSCALVPGAEAPGWRYVVPVGDS